MPHHRKAFRSQIGFVGRGLMNATRGTRGGGDLAVADAGDAASSVLMKRQARR